MFELPQGTGVDGFKLYVAQRSSFLLHGTFPAKLGIQRTGLSTDWKILRAGLCYQAVWLCSQVCETK